MTRQEVLDYIITTHGDALEGAGVELTDTPQTLYYVLYDAMLYESVGSEAQQAVADAKVTQLIADKMAAAEAEAQQTIAAEAMAEAEASRLITRKADVDAKAKLIADKAAGE